MEYQYTPGARRVLDEAAHWAIEGERLGAPALLLGLLAESECRAAEVLARHYVSTELVQSRWPQFVRHAVCEPPLFSADVQASLSLAAERLHECVCPLEFATEHLLLGLAAADHETAAWLHEQGIHAGELEDEIYRCCGYDRSPLPLEEDEEATSPLEPQADALPQGSLAAMHLLAERPGNEVTETVGYRDESSMGTFQPADRIHLLRIIDAAADRAREGLRVVEDYVRFALDDPHLTGQLKRLRHELTAALESLPQDQLLAARETQADVGTRISTSAETERRGLADVVGANFARLQEALRSLEEFGKIVCPAMAAKLERLRYQSYTLERAIESTRSSCQRLADARLYVLLDGGMSESAQAERVQALVQVGVDIIQLRDKTLDDRALVCRARQLRELTRGSRTMFVMNDRPDLAVLADADGVHVGQEELTVKDARTLVGPDRLVGVSTHSIEQARQAVLDGADYIGVGPVFPSGTKQFDRLAGLELVRAVAAEVRLSAFAIGGITADNLPLVRQAGLGRVAVSGAVASAADPGAAARRLLALLS